MSGHILSEENFTDLQEVKNLDYYQKLYEDAIAAAPNHRKGVKITEATRQKMKLAHSSGIPTNKDYVWINNNEEEIMIPKNRLEEYINNSYKMGRLFRHTDDFKLAQAERNKNRPITPEFRQKMSTIAKSTAFANPDLITDERRRRNSE